MAKTTIVEITDDIDGTGGASTLTFALKGVEYSIDLSEKNANKLTTLLQPYIDAGTRVGGRRTSSTNGTKRSDLADIRAWARENGYDVNDRGRISANVMAAYDAR